MIIIVLFIELFFRIAWHRKHSSWRMESGVLINSWQTQHCTTSLSQTWFSGSSISSFTCSLKLIPQYVCSLTTTLTLKQHINSHFPPKSVSSDKKLYMHVIIVNLSRLNFRRYSTFRDQLNQGIKVSVNYVNYSILFWNQ